MNLETMRYKDIQIAEVWEDIRHYRPLVYQLTNMVAANFQANISLAVGASPLMSINAEEASFLASRADSVLINTGTPSDESIRSIKEILPVIRKEKKPLVLDPVGYGASPLRISLVEEILRSEAVTIVKGNRGEMGLLGGEEGTVQGVDGYNCKDLEKALSNIVSSYGVVAVATGKEDSVAIPVPPSCFFLVLGGGSPLLPAITASGCAVGSLIAACSAVTADYGLAAITALVAVSLASEKAAGRENVYGPGTFGNVFIDEVSCLVKSDFYGYEERLNRKEEWRE